MQPTPGFPATAYGPGQTRFSVALHGFITPVHPHGVNAGPELGMDVLRKSEAREACGEECTVAVCNISGRVFDRTT